MSSTSDDTQAAMIYPTVNQCERWRNRANDLEMSISEFIQAIVEVGIKVNHGFKLELKRDESPQELREQQDELRDELKCPHERIKRLERQVCRGERGAIIEFIKKNPGASHAEVGQHIVDSCPERLQAHIEFLNRKKIRVDDDPYHPISSDEVDQ